MSNPGMQADATGAAPLMPNRYVGNELRVLDMNAIGRSFLFVFTGGAYFLLFVTISPLLGRILLKIHYTGYWYPIIVALTFSILFIIHKQVSKYIQFSLNVNTGRVLLKNIGKSALLLLAVLIFAQILFSTGILEGKLF